MNGLDAVFGNVSLCGCLLAARACVINLRHFVDRWYSQLRKMGFVCNSSFKCWYCQSIGTYHFLWYSAVSNPPAECFVLYHLKLGHDHFISSPFKFVIDNFSHLTLQSQNYGYLVKETAGNWFGCIALRAIVSYNVLVKLAHFFF